MTPHDDPPGFLDFGWQSWAVLAAFVVVVVLFLGPGMWSSSTEPLWTTLWRSFRQPSKPDASEAPPIPAPPKEGPAAVAKPPEPKK